MNIEIKWDIYTQYIQEHKKIKQQWTTSNIKERFYIYGEWCFQYKEEGGMGVVIKKLTHPYSFTQKNYKQKWMRLFL